MYKGVLIEKADLPKKLVSYSPCFRAEAGAHGRDTKGLIRLHQFMKVEMVQLTTPEASDNAHEEMCGHAESILQALQLPYRKVSIPFS